MRKFVFITFVLAVLADCNGYSFVIPAGLKHPGSCFYNGLLLKQGDNSLPTTCQNVHCNEDGSMLVQGCGHFDMTDCRVIDPVNIHKPYPECCRMNFLCKNQNGEVVQKEISLLDRKLYA